MRSGFDPEVVLCVCDAGKEGKGDSTNDEETCYRGIREARGEHRGSRVKSLLHCVFLWREARNKSHAKWHLKFRKDLTSELSRSDIDPVIHFSLNVLLYSYSGRYQDVVFVDVVAQRNQLNKKSLRLL
jgi:hypothetical protein